MGTEPLTMDQQAWVDETLAGLDLRERVGQMLFPMLTPDTARPLSVPEYVVETAIGGGHVFGGPVASCRERIAEAQAAAKVPLLISGDFHSGPGERIPEATHWPPLMAIGAGGEEDLAYAYGRSVAVEGGAAGYNLAFGPMVDLAELKDYQRQVDSFGRRPEEVARLATAAIRGLQESGMAACAKHFPGDGFDDRDQHLMTEINPLSAADWRANSAVPFAAAIDAGVWTIMVSCIGLYSIDAEGGDPRRPRPAVVSPALVDGLLRKEMGFEGVIITDALNMGGVSYRHRQLDRYRAALAAGNDVLLFVRDVPKALEHLVDCVKRGEIAESRIDESVRRILALKARLGLHERRMQPDASGAGDAASRAAADRTAEKSITLLSDREDIVPLKLKPGSRVAVVLITNIPAERFTLGEFEAELTAAGCEVGSFPDPQTDEVHDTIAAGGFDAVITVLYFPQQYGWNTSRIHGPYSRCVMSGYPIADAGCPAVYISFGNPYHLYELPQMDPYLVAYSGSPSSQRAAARAIVGAAPITGKIPCRLQDFFEIGDGLER